MPKRRSAELPPAKPPDQGEVQQALAAMIKAVLPAQKRQASARSNVRMITGAQIRAARALLGWEVLVLAQRAKVRLATLIRAEGVDGQPDIAVVEATALRRALESAGVEFATGEQPDVRQREKPQ